MQPIETHWEIRAMLKTTENPINVNAAVKALKNIKKYGPIE